MPGGQQRDDPGVFLMRNCWLNVDAAFFFLLGDLTSRHSGMGFGMIFFVVNCHCPQHLISDGYFEAAGAGLWILCRLINGFR